MLQEADMGLTNMALESNNSRYQGDEFLLVKFFTHPKLDPQGSAEKGRPIYVETPYVQIMQPGNKDSIIQRPATEMDKNRFAEHFRKYEARETEEHIEGTPLEMWPGITRSQCEELKFLNVVTVEQLANISDSNAQNVMGIAYLKQKAQIYLESSKDEATTQALADAQSQIQELREILAAQGLGPAEGVETPPVGDEEEEQVAPPEKTKRRRRKAS